MNFREIFADRKMVFRIILFVIVLAVAVTAFSFAVLGLSKNKEGYQVIDAEVDEEALLYAHDFTFTYHFKGRSGEIKELRNAVTAAYSGALKRAYKLFDEDNTYNGYENIASLNSKKGSALSVGPELYGALKDAYLRTCENKGYNMFAGALYSHVRDILILTEPEGFDPLNDPDEKERRDRLCSLVNDPECFRLEFLDDEKYLVRFSTSEKYDEAMEDLEEDAPALNLNLLKNAYILEITGRALLNMGYTDGYITTADGLTLSLSTQSGLEYCIYGLSGSDPAILETLALPGTDAGECSVFSAFRAFGFKGEDMYYTVRDDGKTIYRNRFIGALDGYESEKYLSLYSVLNGVTGKEALSSLPDAVYRNLLIWKGAEAKEADLSCNEGSRGKYLTCSVLRSAPEKVLYGTD